MRQSGESKPSQRSRSICVRKSKRTTLSFHQSLAASHVWRRLGDPRHLTEHACRGGCRVGQQIEQATPQSLRGDHRGGVDARPATLVEPHFCPRVRVGLPDEVVLANGIPLAALVPRDHPRGNAGRAHHRDERRSVVAAEPALRVENEVVDRIQVQQRRCQRVFEAALAEQVEHRSDVLLIGRARDRASPSPARSSAGCDSAAGVHRRAGQQAGWGLRIGSACKRPRCT